VTAAAVRRGDTIAAMSRAAVLVAACSLVLAACGDDGASTTDAGIDATPDAPIDAVADAPAGPLALTSPMLTEGAMFPRDATCNGANRSLPLTWTGTPVGTLSYAVVLTDTTNNLIHWVIYDIPQPLGGLPEDVDKTYTPTDVPGAHQSKSYDMQVTGYLGPCPPAMHTYRFTLYALDVATLPGATVATPRAALQTSILEHDLASATLTGTYVMP
jgi:Raf kinase inhibitor-like YbhB/YbcL family protein